MVRPRLKTVERITRSGFERIGVRAVTAQDRPVVIGWDRPRPPEAVIDALTEGLGGSPVALFAKPTDLRKETRSTVTKMPLQAFLSDETFSRPGDRAYRVVTNIKNRPALVDALLGASAIPVFGKIRSGDHVNVWVNFAGHFGRAHFDELENFNLQLAGRKRFTLAPPGRRAFYPRPLMEGCGHHSAFPDLRDVDEDRYPLFERVRGQIVEAVLEPGDMLYIPLGWWHQVDSEGALNVNMNFWFARPKLFRRPYVMVDAVYKAAYRRWQGRYDYQPEPLGDAAA